MTTLPPEPIKVGFNIDLSTVVGVHYRQTGEDDWAETPETLGDRVASLIAEKVYRDVKNKDGWYRHDEINEAIDKALAERVAAVLDKQVSPTDAFGNPKGAPTTLAEMVDARLTTWLREGKSTDSYRRNGTTNLQTIIDAAVGNAVTKDVNEAIKQAKVEVVAQVQASAMQVFTETITRAAGVRP